MSREEIIERERRWARPAALACLLVVVLFIAGTALRGESQSPDINTEAELLRTYYENRASELWGSVLQGLAFALMAVPIAYLLQAAAARSPAVRRAFLGIAIAGPLFLAIGTVLLSVAYRNAATEFVTSGGGAGVPVSDYAEDLIRDQAAFSASQGFNLGGVLGLVGALIYTSLHAMRTGLLKRFFATFGMALAALLIIPLVPTLPLLGIVLWIGWLGLTIIGRVPGGRPPAWDAGVAIPWPRPGEEPPQPREEPAAADAIEGDAHEVPAGAENPNVARRERARRRKRKRRQ